MSRRRSRSAITSDSGRSKRAVRVSSSSSALAKWRALKRPVFGSTRASSWSGGTESERWIRKSGATAKRISHGFERQKAAGIPDREAAGELQHRRHQDVVDRDERDGGRCPGQGVRDAVVVRKAVEAGPGGQHGQRPVADVEALDVPGGARLQPLREVVDD